MSALANPFLSALTRWAETLANGSAQLDPLTKARLRSLAGHIVDIEFEPTGDAMSMRFDGESVHISASKSVVPTVRVRGSIAAIAGAIIGLDKSASDLTIEGDELVLEQIRAMIREYRPDVFPRLDALVGHEAAQSLTGLVELGASILGSLARGMRDEGKRIARVGAMHSYLTRRDFDAFIESMGRLRVEIDRLDVRANLLAQSREGKHG